MTPSLVAAWRSQVCRRDRRAGIAASLGQPEVEHLHGRPA